MSVPHAIILLGWDTVRNLVSTVRYIEHFAARGAGVGEMLLVSVLSAAHSRDIAAVIGYPSPEEAHLTGLFRNLGEVLIGCQLSAGVLVDYPADARGEHRRAGGV